VLLYAFTWLSTPHPLTENSSPGHYAITVLTHLPSPSVLQPFPLLFLERSRSAHDSIIFLQELSFLQLVSPPPLLSYLFQRAIPMLLCTQNLPPTHPMSKAHAREQLGRMSPFVRPGMSIRVIPTRPIPHLPGVLRALRV
jgi:hypothetical protein